MAADDRGVTETGLHAATAHPCVHLQDFGLTQILGRLLAALKSFRPEPSGPLVAIEVTGSAWSVVALPIALLLVACLAWQYALTVQTRRTVDALQRLGGAVYKLESGEIVVRIGADADGRSLDLLSRLPKIDALDFAGTGLNDSQLERLALLRSIRRLNLSNTQITDRGLGVISSFPELESLSLDGTSVSPEGIKLMLGIRSLRHLSVCNTLAPQEAVEIIRRERPELDVIWVEKPVPPRDATAK